MKESTRGVAEGGGASVEQLSITIENLSMMPRAVFKTLLTQL